MWAAGGGDLSLKSEVICKGGNAVNWTIKGKHLGGKQKPVSLPRRGEKADTSISRDDY